MQIAGGAEALAKTLGVPLPALRMWLDGRPIPSDVFMRAVDIVIDHDVETAKTEAPQPRSGETPLA